MASEQEDEEAHELDVLCACADLIVFVFCRILQVARRLIGVWIASRRRMLMSSTFVAHDAHRRMSTEQEEAHEVDVEAQAPQTKAQQAFSKFMTQTFQGVPDDLVTIYGDSLLLNFQIIQWYQREIYYLFGFRLLFALMYYSVPFLVGRVVTNLSLLAPETASVLELLLVSFYTNPMISRTYNEFRLFYRCVPIWQLILINLDIPLILVLYTSSIASLQKELQAMLSGLGWVVPAFLGYLYCLYKKHTLYAFGFAELYCNIPAPLFFDSGVQPTNFRNRLGKELAPLVQAGQYASTLVGSIRPGESKTNVSERDFASMAN
eukprot:g83364.t1